MSYIGQGLPADTFQGFTTDSFTGDGSATTFTLSKEPFSEDTLIVVINNVIQKPTTNFTVSGTTLTIVGTAVASGDVIYAIHMGGPLPIGSASALDATTACTITTDDNTDTLSLISTDADANAGPNLRFYRNSSSPADDDVIGRVDFEGRNNNSEDIIYANIQGEIMQEADGSEDGQLQFGVMKAGTLRNAFTIDRVATVFNEDSQDIDFRVESNANTHQFMVDGGNNSVLINKSSPSTNYNHATSLVPGFEIFGTSNTDNRISAFTYGSDDAGAHIMMFGKQRDATPDSYTVAQADDQMGNILFQGADGTHFISGAAIRAYVESGVGANDMPGQLRFYTNSGTTDVTERMRIDGQYGGLLINKTDRGNTTGSTLDDANGVFTVVSGAAVFTANRLANDGIIMAINQASSNEGNISVSGSTVTYGGFTGTHWSRLADNSKPTILRGTIMESLDTMMDWYQVRKDIPEVKYTAEDKEVKDGFKNVGDIKKKADTAVQSIALPEGKSVGDSMDFSFWGNDYTGTIVKEGDVKHVYCKISDTADSKKVYGLFSNWDDADDGLDGDVNDMNIAQVGTFIIRVNKDVTVEAGDLLVSNGDGTAKKQDDDIIRSKTVAKVNSNIKVETYSDGSYTVPCTLHC